MYTVHVNVRDIISYIIKIKKFMHSQSFCQKKKPNTEQMQYFLHKTLHKN